MDWITLVATLTGAGIATATSLLTEMRKDRRNLAAEWRRTRRDLYVAFLGALVHSRSDLLTLSSTEAAMAAGDLPLQARRIFAPCYEVRHQLELLAPDAVVTPALAYFRCVRRLRDLVGEGGRAGEERWDVLMGQIKETLRQVYATMRADLAML